VRSGSTPWVIFVAVTAGILVFGVAEAVVAVPLVAVVRRVIEVLRAERPAGSRRARLGVAFVAAVVGTGAGAAATKGVGSTSRRGHGTEDATRH
jgi:predicted PurR-regulated permease PerM